MLGVGGYNAVTNYQLLPQIKQEATQLRRSWLNENGQSVTCGTLSHRKTYLGDSRVKNLYLRLLSINLFKDQK